MEAEEDAEWERDSLDERPGANCVKIGLPGKLILSYYFKRIGLPKDLFSY